MEVRGHSCESARCNSRGSCYHKLAHEVGPSDSPQLHTFQQIMVPAAPATLARYDLIVSIDIVHSYSAPKTAVVPTYLEAPRPLAFHRRGRMGSINSTGRPWNLTTRPINAAGVAINLVLIRLHHSQPLGLLHLSKRQLRIRTRSLESRSLRTAAK